MSLAESAASPLAAAESMPDDSELARFASAVADDLAMLADLHDRPLTAAVVDAARQAPLAEQLALSPQKHEGRQAAEDFDRALGELPAVLGRAELDELAAQHADVYARFGYRVAATESVWLSEDGLDHQEPAFKVARWYRRHGLRVQDASRRPDDHLFLELSFLVHLLGAGAASIPEPLPLQERLAEAARFLDQHPLRWVGKRAPELERRGGPPIYVALAAITAAYLEGLREALREITGIERPVPAPEADKSAAKHPREKTCADPDDRPYVPGAGPGW